MADNLVSSHLKIIYCGNEPKLLRFTKLVCETRHALYLHYLEMVKIGH